MMVNNYELEYDDFVSNPFFNDVFGILLKWMPFPIQGIGGAFSKGSNDWDRYAQSLPRFYTQDWLGIEFKTIFRWGSNDYTNSKALFGIANSGTSGDSVFKNCILFTMTAVTQGTNDFDLEILVCDRYGTQYSSTKKVNILANKDTEVIFKYDPTPGSKSVSIDVTDVSGTPVSLWAGGSVSLPDGIEFEVDVAGVFNERTVPTDPALLVYLYEMYAVLTSASEYFQTLPRKHDSSLIHTPRDGSSISADLVEIGTASGSWNRRENSPGMLNVDLLNINNRYSSRFQIGDSIKFFLGRKGKIEPRSIINGKIKNDLDVRKSPTKSRVSFVSFDLMQDLADDKIWLWNRTSALFLTKGYTFTPFTDVTSTWNVDDASSAGPPNAVNDASYFAYGVQFNGVQYEVDATTISRVVVWEYYDMDSESWQPLTIYEDTGNHFKTSGVQRTRWERPHNWKPIKVSTDSIERYWVRARITTIGDTVYTLDYVKILNDYDGKAVEFAIKDIVKSLYGQPLKTNFIMATNPTVNLLEGNVSSSGGSKLDAIKQLAKFAFISKYPYGPDLPYYISQDEDEIIFRPYRNPDETATYVDLVMGKNLKSVKANWQTDKMKNELIGIGESIFASIVGRGSIRKYGFRKGGTVNNGGETNEGDLRDFTIHEAREGNVPGLVLTAEVLGIFSIPKGAIVSVSGADEFDSKYIVKGAYGSFTGRSMKHFLVLATKKTTVLEAIDGI